MYKGRYRFLIEAIGHLLMLHVFSPMPVLLVLLVLLLVLLVLLLLSL